MKHELRRMNHRSIAQLVLTAAFAFCASTAAAQWQQLGGPRQDFTAPEMKLAPNWNANKPQLLWRRPLGPGDASIVGSGDALFTMYRKDDREHVIAVRRQDGATLWEHSYEVEIPEDLFVEYGDGPHATPLVAGRRLLTIGLTGKAHCLDTESGHVLWSLDIVERFGAKLPMCGHSAGFLRWDDAVILPVGGESAGVVALELRTGAVLWKALSGQAGYATAKLIEVEGAPQVVVFMAGEAAGLDPDTGKVLWRVPHETEYGVNASMPVFTPPGDLLLTSAYGTGAQLLKLSGKGENAKAEVAWKQKDFQVQYTSVLRIGDTYYGSVGDRGPSLMMAIDAKTGERLWREREPLSRAALLQTSDHVLALDMKGKLALLELSPTGMKTLAEHTVFDDLAFALPAPLGNTLLVRTKKEMMAIALPEAQK